MTGKPARNPSLSRDLLLTGIILALMALIALQLGNRRGEGPVMSGPFTVIDGDTLKRDGERLRLSGIDAPERDQTCTDAQGRDWACGRKAEHLLQQLAGRDDAVCRGSGRDRYQRLLVHCEMAGEVGEDPGMASAAARRDIGATMVERGLALAYGSYRSQEAQARAARRGMWAGTFERPQDWRRQQGRDATGPLAAAMDWIRERLAR